MSLTKITANALFQQPPTKKSDDKSRQKPLHKLEIF